MPTTTQTVGAAVAVVMLALVIVLSIPGIEAVQTDVQTVTIVHQEGQTVTPAGESKYRSTLEEIGDVTGDVTLNVTDVRTDDREEATISEGGNHTFVVDGNDVFVEYNSQVSNSEANLTYTHNATYGFSSQDKAVFGVLDVWLLIIVVGIAMLLIAGGAF